MLVASAYCTVSESAVMIIAKVIPVALLAVERKVIYKRKGGGFFWKTATYTKLLVLAMCVVKSKV